MAKSTKSRSADKPAKPREDFPLFPHDAGVWAKKVRGKTHYFGPWSDPHAALDKWLDEKDDLLAGRMPRKRNPDALTVKRLGDTFLTTKRRKLDSGELSPHTYQDYVAVCQFAADHFGKDRDVASISPADFADLRYAFSKRHGPSRLGKDVRIVRMMFRYGMENDLITSVVKFGSDFKEPDKKVKKKAQRKHGPRHFTAAELRTLIDAAQQPLKSMLLLAANCGYGNTDIADLPLSALDLESGWVEFERPKTGIDRRCPLWTETRKSLREAITARPEPRDPTDAGQVFLTKYGRRFVRLNDHDDPGKRVRVDSIAQELRKVMKAVGINGRRGFYGVRHSFRTAATEAKDERAADFIMGHSRGDMASEYIEERPSDERLRDVANVVRNWLWPPKKKSQKRAKPAKSA